MDKVAQLGPMDARQLVRLSAEFNRWELVEYLHGRFQFGSLDQFLEPAALHGQIGFLDRLAAERSGPLTISDQILNRLISGGAPVSSLAWLIDHGATPAAKHLLMAASMSNLSAIRLLLSRNCAKPDPSFLKPEMHDLISMPVSLT